MPFDDFEVHLKTAIHRDKVKKYDYSEIDEIIAGLPGPKGLPENEK